MTDVHRPFVSGDAPSVDPAQPVTPDADSRSSPLPDSATPEVRAENQAPSWLATLDDTGVGLWQIDETTGVVNGTQRCLIDLAVDSSTVLTRELLLGANPEQRDENWKTLSFGRPFEYDRSVSTGGAHRWILIRGVGHFQNGHLRSVSGITLDITARKRHELEIDARADADRSSRERSEALARAMDHFIAAVSHELRSPLNAIVSWAEVLHLVSEPSMVTRAGEAIRRNGRQLSSMVDDLLDSGAMVTGKLSVHLQPVDLGALAAIVAEDMRGAAERKGLQLHVSEIAASMAMADESRMKQVISNLLNNAFKFTETGSVSISVKTTGDAVEIAVRDTGRGIEACDLPRVFERFQQFAAHSGGRSGGLGLGLWLAKQIVTLHGGEIAVTSGGAGQGSIFTVRIPRLHSR